MFGFVKEVSNENIYHIHQISVTPFSLWEEGEPGFCYRASLNFISRPYAICVFNVTQGYGVGVGEDITVVTWFLFHSVT